MGNVHGRVEPKNGSTPALLIGSHMVYSQFSFSCYLWGDLERDDSTDHLIFTCLNRTLLLMLVNTMAH